MNYLTKFKLPLLISSAILLIAGIGFYFSIDGKAPPFNGGDLPMPENNENIILGVGESGTVNGITITPKEIIEDSRCPIGVSCIQAGRVRIIATIIGIKQSLDKEFLVGEPIVVEGNIITLLKAEPEMISGRTIDINDYRFTFKIIKQGIVYKNASENIIKVNMPSAGSVTGRRFKITGEARGYWFFEASFPVELQDKNGNGLTIAIAQAKKDWMTEEFVPFEAEVSVPDDYSGEAILILKRDNPSDLPENNASMEFPITIEY